MLVAELELFLSRPVAPTRRISLGEARLPASPRPGFGGLLLGGIVAAFAPGVDPDLLPDVHHLIRQIEHGAPVTQPRLRHRLQQDRVGLTSHVHRLRSDGDGLTFDLDERGNAMPHVLGAIYAAGRLPAEDRPGVVETLRRGLAWRSDIGPALVAHLGAGAPGGVGDWTVLGGAEPRAWALEQFGLTITADRLDPAVVQRRFRELLRAAHPDHGAEADGAAERIDALARARRILLSS